MNNEERTCWKIESEINVLGLDNQRPANKIRIPYPQKAEFLLEKMPASHEYRTLTILNDVLIDYQIESRQTRLLIRADQINDFISVLQTIQTHIENERKKQNEENKKS